MNRPAQTRLDQADGDRYWQVILWQELAEDLYFDHVTFPAENFEQVRFRNCTLDHCRMGGLAAEHSDWHGVVFRDCDLSNLNLGDAVLSQVRFEDCKLVGANLSACGLHGVEFVRCNLSYSNFSLCQGRDLSFVECGPVSYTHLDVYKRQLLGINATGQQQGEGVENVAAQHLWFLADGQGVHIHNGIDAVVIILHLNPVAHRPQIVAQGHGACGLDAGKDNGFFGGNGCGGRLSLLHGDSSIHGKMCIRDRRWTARMCASS